MALPESTSQGGQKSSQNDQEDKDFDPSAEDIIDEIDDERTLEEEEALGVNNGVAVQEELDDLKKESEMPIEELLAYYERMRNEAQGDDEQEEDDDDDDELDEGEEEEGDDDEDDNNAGKSNLGGNAAESSSSSSHHHQHQQNPTESKHSQHKSTYSSLHKQHKLLPNGSQAANSSAHQSITSSSALNSPSEAACRTSDQNLSSGHRADRHSSEPAGDQPKPVHTMTDFPIDDGSGGDMFRTLLNYDLDDSDDLDEDYSYTDDENGDDERDWRRSIHVGPEHQAEVPEGLCEYGDLPPYENEDKLVWKCNVNVSEEQVVDFLKKASSLAKRNDISISSASVPKISNDSLRMYRERMQDITSSTGSRSVEDNHENINTNEPAQQSQLSHQQEQPPPTTTENLQDVYMSQSRKRIKIDYELEQENAMDGMLSNPPSGLANQSAVTPKGDDNHDSVSQDTSKPELSTEDYFQDEEQLLYLLLQCNCSVEEALRRRKLDPFKYYLYEPMSLWSEQECLGFENGLRNHGKNFRLIRENEVQTRTHAEVVAFYYLWKKSERHDVYTNQYKLDRKRCLSHPGTTDYMDKFIEDNESALNASSSAATTPVSTTVNELGGDISSTNSEPADSSVNINPPISSELPYGLVNQAPPNQHQRTTTIQLIDAATVIIQQQQHHHQHHHLQHPNHQQHHQVINQGIQAQHLAQNSATQAYGGVMSHKNSVNRSTNSQQ